MVAVARLHYSIPTNSAVRWLTTQERNLNKELPYPDEAAETPEEYVSRMYLQFLWLPQVRFTAFRCSVRFFRISGVIFAVTTYGEVQVKCRVCQG